MALICRDKSIHSTGHIKCFLNTYFGTQRGCCLLCLLTLTTFSIILQIPIRVLTQVDPSSFHCDFCRAVSMTPEPIVLYRCCYSVPASYLPYMHIFAKPSHCQCLVQETWQAPLRLPFSREAG